MFETIGLYPNFQRYIQALLRFNEEPEIQKQALSIFPTGFIRTFDVSFFFEVKCVLLRSHRNTKVLAFVSAD